MRPLSVAGVEGIPGQSVLAEVEIARLPTRTPVTLPVYLFQGKEEGPVLLLTAGIHGDEVAGVEIVRKMVRKNLLMPKKGAVIAIPLVNIFGFLEKSRELPDGRDLNRSFPGNADGSLAARIAHVLTGEILPLADYGVDFHTGGGRRFNHPQIRCNLEDQDQYAMAMAFAAPFAMHARFREDSFRERAHKCGVKALLFEGGESLDFDTGVTEAGVDGTRRLMEYLGMVPKEREREEKRCVLLDGSRWVRANHSGLFRSRVKTGEKVKRGQILGSVSDPFGEEEFPLKAREGGWVIAVNRLPVVNKGDAVLHIGKEKL